MKKKTNLQQVEGETRTHRTGPVKTRTQVTVRLDSQLMKAANAQMKSANLRITDLIERGLRLAINEAEYLPSLTGQVRFVLANCTKEQERLIRGLAIRMLETEVEARSEEGEMIFTLVRSFLESANLLEHGATVLELYARYGKSAQDIAKLG